MPAQIHYFTLQDETPRKEKLDWFRNNKLSDLEMERIHPDEKGNWLNITDNDFEDLLPLASKEVKGNKAGVEFDKAVFKLFCLGVSTNRDEWVYDFNKKELQDKNIYFIDEYNRLLGQREAWESNGQIKWSNTLKSHFIQNRKITFNKELIKLSNYRPFVKMYYNAEKLLSDRLTQNHFDIFGKNIDKENRLIGTLKGDRLDFATISTSLLPNLATFSLDPANWFPLYRYDETGNRIENITDWGLEQFINHYQATANPPKGFEPLGGFVSGGFVSGLITKEAIFHYVYAVLHNPAYRKKYEQNLKRDFPRIPFYDDFQQWATWGKALMDLHINYENAALFPLNRVERVISQGASSDQRQLFARVEEVEPLYKTEVKIKPKLKADKEVGTIEIDEQTTLTGIPTEAWAYKLGNRSALEWILDQYKESKPTDPTILEKFNHYRFADYKEEVIVLLQKVCTVSVETMKIIRVMETLG